MLGYLKVLDVFIISVLFGKGEFDFRSKNFKPLRVMFMLVFMTSVGVNIYFIKKFNKLYDVIKVECKHILPPEPPPPKKIDVNKNVTSSN